MAPDTRYRLIAMDLDGTLLTPESQLTPQTLEVLREVHRQGIVLMFCTGRTLHKAQEVITPIPFACLLALHNGAVVVEHPTGRVLIQRTLPFQQAVQVIRFLETHRFHTAAYTLHDSQYRLHYVPDFQHVGLQKFLATKGPILSPCATLSDCLDRPALHIVAVDREERIRWARRMLRERFAGLTVIASGGFYGGEYWFLEVLAEGASKSDAVAAIARRRGIPREAILAIGDNYNDLDMLRYAGTSVAMGNAPPEVQAHADLIAESNRNEGVAKVLRRLVLSGGKG